jgi:hypothetical protein
MLEAARICCFVGIIETKRRWVDLGERSHGLRRFELLAFEKTLPLPF